MSTNPSKGYYSILQFVPDLEKSEGANIGIVLFCPDKGYLKVQTSNGNDRVRRFFGPEIDLDLDLDRINAFKAAFEERLEFEASRLKTREDFLQFVNTRANQLLLTSPRPIKVFEPDSDLARLFESLVGGRRKPRLSALSSREELKQEFAHRLVERGIADRVQRDLSVESALLDRTLVFPFAFRNGRINVIEPVSFEGSKKSNIDRACQLAVQGQDLIGRPDPIQLNVLGSFDPRQPEALEHVREVLGKYAVAYHSASDMNELVELVARAAH
ncbi:MAG TPA: DUF3037 domain-containing protein [Pyrinomonadaceae bacterium]|nr:DUF3037 domain-containing protein [Pyrinomonadaceae bacterium]